MSLSLALFRSFEAEPFIELYGPEETMCMIQAALADGSQNVWETLNAQLHIL